MKMNVRKVEEQKWLFLDYSDEGYGIGFDARWFIETRPGQEGFWLVCNFPYTFASESALSMIEEELALARPAMDEIRRQAQIV